MPLLPVCEVKLLGCNGECAARKITSKSTNRVFANNTSKVGQTPLETAIVYTFMLREPGRTWFWYQIIVHIHHN